MIKVRQFNIKNKANFLVFKKSNNRDTFWLVSLGQQLYCKCCLTLSLNELLQVGKDSQRQWFLTNYNLHQWQQVQQPPSRLDTGMNLHNMLLLNTGTTRHTSPSWPNSHCPDLPSRNKKLPTQGLLANLHVRHRVSWSPAPGQRSPKPISSPTSS